MGGTPSFGEVIQRTALRDVFRPCYYQDTFCRAVFPRKHPFSSVLGTDCFFCSL